MLGISHIPHGSANRQGPGGQAGSAQNPPDLFRNPDLFGNIDSRPLAAIFTLCATVYLGIYALEAPLRFALYLLGKDDLILLRDGLIIGPLVLLFAAQALRLRIHAAFILFIILITFHGMVLMGTIGSALGAAYGVKILVNVLFGFFIASLLIQPGTKTTAFLLLIWLVTMVGIGLDKFVLTFPWTGIKTVVGDLNVDVSRDWQIEDPLLRRVAGFTRSSICAAVLLPPLTIILLTRAKHWLLRGALILTSLAAVGLTTQKGALFAFAPIAALLLLPSASRKPLLQVCCVVFAVTSVAIPFLTMGLHFTQSAGVFSTESLDARVAETWPQAWQWITRHQMLIFGVGLGGISGPQRLYAPGEFNPADNFFILLYAYFGVFALLYLSFVVWLSLRRVTGSEERAMTAIAILAFIFGYGVVLSVIEDQSAALFFGVAIGVLWQETTQEIKKVASFSGRTGYVRPTSLPTG